jgi:hypothetical protein
MVKIFLKTSFTGAELAFDIAPHSQPAVYHFGDNNSGQLIIRPAPPPLDDEPPMFAGNYIELRGPDNRIGFSCAISALVDDIHIDATALPVIAVNSWMPGVPSGPMLVAPSAAAVKHKKKKKHRSSSSHHHGHKRHHKHHGNGGSGAADEEEEKEEATVDTPKPKAKRNGKTPAAAPVPSDPTIGPPGVGRKRPALAVAPVATSGPPDETPKDKRNRLKREKTKRDKEAKLAEVAASTAPLAHVEVVNPVAYTKPAPPKETPELDAAWDFAADFGGPPVDGSVGSSEEEEEESESSDSDDDEAAAVQ